MKWRSRSVTNTACFIWCGLSPSQRSVCVVGSLGRGKRGSPRGIMEREKKRPFRQRVVSLTSYVVPLRSGTSAANIYASFSRSWYKKVRYACIYLVLSATDQAKAVGELTQNVCETTSDVSEQDVTLAELLVLETTFNRFSVIAIFNRDTKRESLRRKGCCGTIIIIYPWFKFCFQSFQTHYHQLPCTEKQRKIKGAVSRQSSSFCLILPITCPQSLWNLK